MTLSEKDVRDIATYTRIGLTDEEVVTMTRDLNDIIANLEPITQYDLEGVEPTFHPIAGLVNVMREDVPQPGFTQEEALANSESTEDGAFRIPTILGGGDN
ncbi:MAG: Asp-tRNA(Asn)/Glu-tRNA(Gln) amidotransferase subunit GatC [bacterium]|nr:Asp-tRNA(Asn)/Glu-tRNA(Gln) amidotransferase subunit GatC [bacterium]